MPQDHLFLGMYWDIRQESIESCAARCIECFQGFEVHPLLRNWYRQGRSLKQALSRPVDVANVEQWEQLLDKGRHYSNYPRLLMEDMGFSVGLWNGQLEEDDQAVILIDCGAYNPYTSNSLTLELPRSRDTSGPVNAMKSAFVGAVEAWSPDWGGVMSRAAMRQRGFDARRPFADWMFYVSDQLLSADPQVEPPSQRERIAHGNLFVTQQQPPNIQNAEDQRRVQQMQTSLDSCFRPKESRSAHQIE